jgi:hypothetical protein
MMIGLNDIDSQIRELEAKKAQLNEERWKTIRQQNRLDKLARKSTFRPVEYWNCIGQLLVPGDTVVAVTGASGLRKIKPILGKFSGTMLDPKSGVIRKLQIKVTKNRTHYIELGTNTKRKYYWSCIGPYKTVIESYQGKLSIAPDRVFAVRLNTPQIHTSTYREA